MYWRESDPCSTGGNEVVEKVQKITGSYWKQSCLPCPYCSLGINLLLLLGKTYLSRGTFYFVCLFLVTWQVLGHMLRKTASNNTLGCYIYSLLQQTLCIGLVGFLSCALPLCLIRLVTSKIKWGQAKSFFLFFFILWLCDSVKIFAEPPRRAWWFWNYLQQDKFIWHYWSLPISADQC